MSTNRREPKECDGCRQPIWATPSWTLWPWKDGSWLCDDCNDKRHDEEDWEEIEDEVQD